MSDVDTAGATGDPKQKPCSGARDEGRPARRNSKLLAKLALHVKAKSSRGEGGPWMVFSRCVIRGGKKGEMGDQLNH